MKIRKNAEEIIIALGIALLIAGFILLIAYSKPSMYHKPAPVIPAVHPANLRYIGTEGSAEFEPKPPLRLSVVRGGIKSLDDLRLDIQHDPTLAAFLRLHGFDIDTAKFTTLGQDRDVLVSYRPSRNSIVWTKHKVHLLASDIVIVDGNGVMLLAECGNMILPAEPTPSPFPNLTFTPTLFDVPPPFVPETTDAPPPDFVPPIDTAFPPTIAEIASPVSGQTPPCCFVPVGIFSPPISPISPSPTPEPAPALMLVTGIVIIGVLYRHRRAR